MGKNNRKAYIVISCGDNGGWCAEYFDSWKNPARVFLTRRQAERYIELRKPPVASDGVRYEEREVPSCSFKIREFVCDGDSVENGWTEAFYIEEVPFGPTHRMRRHSRSKPAD